MPQRMAYLGVQDNGVVVGNESGQLALLDFLEFGRCEAARLVTLAVQHVAVADDEQVVMVRGEPVTFATRIVGGHRIRCAYLPRARRWLVAAAPRPLAADASG